MSVTCPRCKAINTGDSAFCISCGAPLEASTPPTPAAPFVQSYQTQSSSPVSADVPLVMIEERYKTLRAISSFLTVLAWIFLVIGGLSGIMMGLSQDTGMGLLFVLAGILAGGLLFSIVKAYAELLQIAIDIEENTRLTAELLERE